MDVNITVELGPKTQRMIRSMLNLQPTDDKEVLAEIIEDYRKFRAEVKPGSKATAANKLAEQLRENAAREADETAEAESLALPFCADGCGQKVNTHGAKYILGHNPRKKDKAGKSKTVILKPHDLQITDGYVTCPKTEAFEDITDCDNCKDIVTHMHDGSTGKRYIRCGRADVAP